jgi:hypothetical protein
MIWVFGSLDWKGRGVDHGTLPDGGVWFIVSLKVEDWFSKWRSTMFAGAGPPELTSQREAYLASKRATGRFSSRVDEFIASEMPEAAYVELYPSEGVANVKLLVDSWRKTDDRILYHRYDYPHLESINLIVEAVQKAGRRQSGPGPRTKTQIAVTVAIDMALRHWRETERLHTGTEFAYVEIEYTQGDWLDFYRDIFQTPSGFHGV